MIKSIILKDLLNYLKIHKIKLIISSIFSLIASILIVISSYKFGQIITTLYHNASLDSTIITILIIYLLCIMFLFLKNDMILDISNDIVLNIGNKIINKIEKIPLKYYDSNNHNEILNIIINDVNIINKNFNKILIEIINYIIFTPIIFISIILINFSLGIIILFIYMFFLTIILLISKNNNKNYKLKEKSLNNIDNQINDTINNFDTIKTNNIKDMMLNKFYYNNDYLSNNNNKYLFLYNISLCVLKFIKYILIITILIIGSYLVINNKIEIGYIVTLIIYIILLLQSNIIKIINAITETTYSYNRIIKFLNIDEEINNPISHITINDIKGNIIFDNVCFSCESKNQIINNFNLKIKLGNKVAIVGSDEEYSITLMKLLMRLYEIDSGNIYLDKYNIKDIDRNELKKVFGTVYQGEKYIKNIFFDNNIELSSDQVKLLNIEQVILNNPKILIFFETDNDIDSALKILVEKSISHSLKEYTMIFITNKLSTIKKSNLVIVMSDGKIIESGTHKELLKKNKFYKNKIYHKLK